MNASHAKPKKVHAAKAEKKPVAHKKALHYAEGIGRRKTSVARVRLFEGSGSFVVLGEKERKFQDYFPTDRLRELALAPLEKLQMRAKFDASVTVSGGGIASQADAVRLGVARALLGLDKELKKKLRAYGFLTRDSRAVERKKYGLKKARRAPQWSKR